MARDQHRSPARPVDALRGACVLLALLGTGVAAAQADRVVASDDVFEEIVLTRSARGEPRARAPREEPSRPESRTFMGRGASLKSLVGWAYPLQQWQITGGPDWIEERMFDVTLVVKPGVDDVDRAAALQRFLAERFELEVHYETAPVFILDTLNGGTRLEVSAPTPDGVESRLDEAPGRIAGEAVTMSALIDALSRYLGRPVLDRTALTGRYDFVLEWPLEQPLDEALADVSGAAAHPNLVAALARELGLELRSFPLELLVVDHAVQPLID